MQKYSRKLSEQLFDVISGSAYNEAVLREVLSLELLTEEERIIINAYLTGEASVCINGCCWFKAQDIVMKLNSLGL